MDTDVENKIDEFITNYNKITTAMLGKDSFQIAMIKAINDIFNDAGISSEQKGTALTELSVQTAVSYNKDAVSSALDVIRLAPEFATKEAQVALTMRQVQGFDDNMLLKIVENQAGLAQFAVNANSNSAQSTINELKTKMGNVESRVKKLDDENPIKVTPVTPSPLNVIATNIDANSITIEFTEVQNATLYLVYQDGVLVATQGVLSYTAEGLSPKTKYSFSIKASIDGIESNYTNSLVVQTLSI